MLNPHTGVKLAFFTIYIAVTAFGIWYGRKGIMVPIRRLPAIDAIDTAGKRAAQLGRPFMVILYHSGSYMEDQVLASFDLVRHAAASAARYDAPFLVVTNSPDGLPIAQDIVRDEYYNAGKSEKYDPIGTVRFIAGTGSDVAIAALMDELNVSADLVTGNLMFSTLIFAEQGALLDSLQIGATRNVHQMPFLAASYDYMMIGDELFSAATYISRDPVRGGFLLGQEFGKVFALVAILLGVVLNGFGITSFTKFLTM